MEGQGGIFLSTLYFQSQQAKKREKKTIKVRVINLGETREKEKVSSLVEYIVNMTTFLKLIFQSIQLVVAK